MSHMAKMHKDGKKRCGVCGLWLHLKMFKPDERFADKLHAYCYDCQALSLDADEIMNPMQPHLAAEVFCLKCQEFKPRDQFSPDKRRRSGLYQWCKVCWKTYQRELRYKRSKPLSVEHQIRGQIMAVYGENETPLSVVRAGHSDVAAKVISWFPHMDPARVTRIFYDICGEDARKEKEAQPK